MERHGPHLAWDLVHLWRLLGLSHLLTSMAGMFTDSIVFTADRPLNPQDALWGFHPKQEQLKSDKSLIGSLKYIYQSLFPQQDGSGGYNLCAS